MPKNTQTTPAENVLQPGILDAVVDQHGAHWIRFGTTTDSAFFSLPELQRNEREVFARLAGPGTTFLTSKSKNAFKQKIESQMEYRAALVAAHPGWLENHYVFGDGHVVAPPGDTREVIIGFEPRPKFTPKGTLEGWQDSVGPVVTEQPLALFVPAYAYVAPILRHAPPDILNPQTEIVGERESGKSTLLAFGASVWAGDPNSEVGGAERWDLTINALDTEKLAHGDSLFGLDEGNLAGIDSADRKEVVPKAVFKLSTTSQRRRFTDKSAAPNVRVAMLSTSNTPLSELVSASDAVMGGLQSRLLTIRVRKSSPYGVLEFVPKGFADGRAAMEALRSAVDENYSVAGRAFIRELVKAVAADGEGLRRRIDRLVERFLAELGQGGSARIKKTFAITFAAGVLAREWGVLPKAWGPLLPSLLKVYQSLETAPAVPFSPPRQLSPARAMRRIRRYMRRHRNHLERVRDVEAPLSPEVFDRAPGFLRQVNGVEELLVSSGKFQRCFENAIDLARVLRDAGRARTEGGGQPKLTIKAPNRLCHNGRVYCIRVRG